MELDLRQLKSDLENILYQADVPNTAIIGWVLLSIGVDFIKRNEVYPNLDTITQFIRESFI